MTTTPSFFIIPSFACQASCKYCFGPHRGAVMNEQTAKETIRFIRSITQETGAKDISITFHGGEPLLAPFPVWQILLGEIKKLRNDYRIHTGLQSNLWNLADDLLALFVENNVSIGTSLDGPKEFCDITRGEGYFDKTWASVQKANAAGCSVGAIATIAKPTLPYTQEIAKFFRNNGISLMLHGALNAMKEPENGFALTTTEYATMIKELYPWYIRNRTHLKIDTLDHFVQGIVTGNPKVCTFRDCLGMFLSISPTGDITSCQRFAGREEFCLGHIFDHPTLSELMQSSAAQAQRNREKQVAEQCTGCEHLPVCKGGCYYNAIASGNNVIDSWCQAYKDIFTFVQERVMEEMQSPENIEAITARPPQPDEHPLLRKGAYISLAQEPHAMRIANNARHILALYELSRTNNPHIAAQNLYEQKICGNPTQTAAMLATMQTDLHKRNNKRNNCYLHVTFDCNLRCNHCYADAGDNQDEMDTTRLDSLIEDAISERFRQVIITGGEPLVHSNRSSLLDVCHHHRHRGVNLVLRTNLTGVFSDEDLHMLANSFDQIVVSIDGNEQTHDKRRGKGTYKNVVGNLEAYVRVAGSVSHPAELSLACVMNAEAINGEPGQNVRILAGQLQVKRVRFRPLLPIGRASHLNEPIMCEGLMQHISPDEMLKKPFQPLTTCGIGQNLFVRPDGRSYPCYAWCNEHTYIGNVFGNGLKAVLASPAFTRLTECTVDTIEKCRDCDYRYLCGSACRAWGNRQALDLNAAPVQCSHLKERAQALIKHAQKYMIKQS